jgi:hypothetical protein
MYFQLGFAGAVVSDVLEFVAKWLKNPRRSPPQIVFPAGFVVADASSLRPVTIGRAFASKFH